MIQLIHGGDIYSAKENLKDGQEILDFSANINPLGLPAQVEKVAAQALSRCVNYPDPLCRSLRKELSIKEGISQDQIVFGNGAADIIFRLAAVQKPNKALLLAPTFAEYEQALRGVGCDIDYHYLKRDQGFSLKEDFLDTLDKSLDMIFLCNPNNPTGQLISPKLMKKIIEKCCRHNIFIVIDECFIDFIIDSEKHSVKSQLENYNKLFILRAFTKSYAMAGLRLGYGLCNDKILIKKLFDITQPWSVSLIAQEAGVQALKEDEYLKESTKLIWKEREILYEKLKGFGYMVYPPAANYIFFQLKAKKNLAYIEEFQVDLAKEGILIRSCENYRGLEKGYYRIAIKNPNENQKLITALMRREEQWQKQ
ncbi:MAG: threonine-phosphate decarboxylase CobD [Anaerovoracaceae bacterium]